MAEKLTHLANLEAATRSSPSKTDIVPVLRSAVDSQRRHAKSRHVELVLSLPDDLTALVDGALVGRATTELLTNALNYAPPGSRVAVALRPLDDYFEICVSDEGPGVPAAERDRVIQPFERGESLPGSVSSLGLGLAVASAIAAAHGGTIAMEDNKPRGLIVRMCLKRA